MMEIVMVIGEWSEPCTGTCYHVSPGQRIIEKANNYSLVKGLLSCLRVLKVVLCSSYWSMVNAPRGSIHIAAITLRAQPPLDWGAGPVPQLLESTKIQNSLHANAS